MSSVTPTDERLKTPAETADWRKHVDEMQMWLSAEASALMRSVPPESREAFRNLADRAPIILSKLQDLEKLQQTRLDELEQYGDRWRRTRELEDLNQKVKQKRADLDRLGREVSVLAHQRMDAHEKLGVTIRESEQHKLLTAQEDLRIDNRSAALNTQQQEMEVRGNNMADAIERLRQDRQVLARNQEEERRKEKENETKSAQINVRLDLIAEFRRQENRQVTEVNSRFQNLKAEKDGLAATKNDLEGRVLTLQQQVSEQETQLRQQRHEQTSLQATADKSSSEAQSTERELANARAAFNKAQRQVSDLQKEVDGLRPRGIEFDAARRLQDSSNARIKELEQDLNSMHQEHENLRAKYDRMSGETGKKLNLQNEALEKANQATASVHHRLQEAQLACDTLTAENAKLTDIRDCLKEYNADLVKDIVTKDNDIENAQVELRRLTEQLQSCHCSRGTPSRKRPHDQMDTEEDLSSEYDFDRVARRSEKAPRSMSNFSAAGPSGYGLEAAVRDSASPEILGTAVEEASLPAAPTTSSVGPLMNTAASRDLGTTRSTIMPSDGAAFTISIRDVKLLNFSSDALPLEILEILRMKFRLWIAVAKPALAWDTLQENKKKRSCIECRLGKRTSRWTDGLEYACALCEERGRMCVVVHNKEQVLLLPRKAAEDGTEGPTEATYWMK